MVFFSVGMNFFGSTLTCPAWWEVMHLCGSCSFKCCIGLSEYLVGLKLKKTKTKQGKKDPRVPQQSENKRPNLENFHKNLKTVILQPLVLQHLLFPTNACFINCKEEKGFEEGQVGAWVQSHSSTHI